MNLSFLANPKFGWIFIWSEITLIYLAFLWFHRQAQNPPQDPGRFRPTH